MCEFTYLSFTSAAVWGTLVALSCVGYGWVLSRIFRLKSESCVLSEFSLYAGWGLAVWIIAGGLLNYLALVSAPLLIVLVIIGDVLAVAGFMTSTYAPMSASDRPLWILAGLCAAFIYFLHVADWRHNLIDDFTVYGFLPHQMLETGTCIDPYSWRRLSSLGGQSFMHALILAGSGFPYLQLFDRALCSALSIFMVAGLMVSRGVGGSLPARAFLVLFTLFPLPCLNSGAISSAICLLLTVLLSIERVEALRLTPIKFGALLGLLFAAYVSLKANHLLVTALFIPLLFSSRFLCISKLTASVEFAAFLVSFIACIAPWARLSQISSGTCLYPFLYGNQPVGFAGLGISGPNSQRISFVLNYLFYPTLSFHLISFFLFKPWTRFHLCAVIIVTALVQFLVVAYRMALVDSNMDATYRYSAPPLIVASLLCIISVLEPGNLRLFGLYSVAPVSGIPDVLARFWPVALVMVMTSTCLTGDRFKFFTFPPQFPIFTDTKGVVVSNEIAIADYKRFQALIPPGEAVLCFINHPYLLDIHRNPVTIGDMPGACSPPPHMPLFQGPRAMAQYLQENQFHYVLYSSFDTVGYYVNQRRNLYGRGDWLFWLNSDVHVWRAHAPYFLDFMDSLDKIAVQNTLRKDDYLTLIHVPKPTTLPTTPSIYKPESESSP